MGTNPLSLPQMGLALGPCCSCSGALRGVRLRATPVETTSLFASLAPSPGCSAPSSKSCSLSQTWLPGKLTRDPRSLLEGGDFVLGGGIRGCGRHTRRQRFSRVSIGTTWRAPVIAASWAWLQRCWQYNNANYSTRTSMFDSCRNERAALKVGG